MPRFLHTADWQLGRQYGRFAEEDAAILAQARFDAVARIAELATREQVAAVLVAGDVFDAQTVSDRTLHRAFQATAGFTGPWIMLPGNHDAALAESVWTRARRLGAVPANVHPLLVPQVALFEELGFAVLPAPLTQRQTHEDLSAWFDRAETPPQLLRMGLAHGSIGGELADLVDAHNPIAADRAERARLDYLALGDWHGCRRVAPRTWYSGTPEPDRFKDNNPGKALVVDIAAPGAEPVVAEHPIARHTWFQRQRQLVVASDVDALRVELDALPPDSVLDLTLSGQLDLASHRRLQQALGAAAGRQRSLQVQQQDLRLQPTDEDLATLHADGYVAEVIAELRRRQEDGTDEPRRATAGQALAILASLLHEFSETTGAA